MKAPSDNSSNRLLRLIVVPTRKKRRASKTCYRTSSIETLIMSRLHARPKQHRSSTFRIADVRTVLDLFGNKSVLSGDSHDLTLIRITKDNPLNLNNAMVVTVREASRAIPEEVRQRALAIVTGKQTQPQPSATPDDHNPLAVIVDRSSQSPDKALCPAAVGAEEDAHTPTTLVS